MTENTCRICQKAIGDMYRLCYTCNEKLQKEKKAAGKTTKAAQKDEESKGFDLFKLFEVKVPLWLLILAFIAGAWFF